MINSTVPPSLVVRLAWKKEDLSLHYLPPPPVFQFFFQKQNWCFHMDGEREREDLSLSFFVLHPSLFSFLRFHWKGIVHLLTIFVEANWFKFATISKKFLLWRTIFPFNLITMKVNAGTGKPLLYIRLDLLITIVIMKKRISEKTSYFEISIIIAKNKQLFFLFLIWNL